MSEIFFEILLINIVKFWRFIKLFKYDFFFIGVVGEECFFGGS